MCELLKNIPREKWITSTLISNNQHIKDAKLVKTIPFFPNQEFRGKWRIMTELNMPYTKCKLRTANWDIFHPTYFATPYLNLNYIKDKPLIITIHDLIYDVFYKDKNIPHCNEIIDMGKRSAKQANKIIAVSEYTKQDMIREWGIDEKKIEVIYHGVDKEKYPISKDRLVLNPYIFFAGGARGANKNFEHLIEAFSIVSKKYKDLKLVCSGTKFTNQEEAELQRLKIHDKVINFYATEMEMAQLYNDAEMLVVPSYYEGFGMPILEAMVYDCPVVVSDASCFPEIAGEAGIYFNPYDAEEMSEKITLLLENDSLREQQQKNGQKRLENFSWQKCANEHLAVYNSLL
jgi:glycosyltransferase involved in cell wall biosynthesis